LEFAHAATNSRVTIGAKRELRVKENEPCVFFSVKEAKNFFPACRAE
jgi:hypothetical protein